VRRFSLTVIVVLIGLVSTRAEILDLPAEWFDLPPTHARIAGLQATAATSGWGSVSISLYLGAIRAYERGQIDSAEAWYYVASWANLFGQTQATVGNQWWESVNKAGLATPNLRKPVLSDELISQLLTPEMVSWLMSDRAFSAAFWGMVSPNDYLPQVLLILTKIRESNPVRFKSYSQLALAISLVYDSPPPRSWPHEQVTETALKRQLLQPWEVFKFLVDTDEAGATLLKLGQLNAGDLRFLVDFSAPFMELAWAQKSVKFTLAQMPQSYSCVRYRQDRIDAGQYVWPDDTYQLPLIYSEGGICVDQAYFASETGKARGVPTLLFVGDGKDGRHAWFGYLDRSGKWILDVGRYQDQHFVTGFAYDPQTWSRISDHELSFLSEGFRKLPPYKQSSVQALFAGLYLRLGGEKGRASASLAARKAVNYERRNTQAWDILIAANAEAPPVAREALLREAAMALQRYPDLNAFYLRQLASSLKARGEVSAANFEERSLAIKNKNARADIGVEQAAKIVNEMLGTDMTVQQQMAIYGDALKRYGVRGGMDFYDQVVMPFVAKLVEQGHRGEARVALGQARFILKPETDSQLEREIIAFDARLK